MNGCELIAAERLRQVDEEGWSFRHDTSHDEGELAVRAAELAVDRTDSEIRVWENAVDAWGLVAKHGRKGSAPDHIRALVIAGALIAAEIDRIQPAPEPTDG